MTFLPLMRVAAQLRRIARALEAANRLEEVRQEFEFPTRMMGKPRMVEIHLPTVKEWNEAYAKAHPELEEDGA